MHPEFAPVAFIAAFSLILPLPWHWRARNVATLSIIAWLFISNLIYAIDAIIWAGNLNVVAVVWCDISTKLIIGANFALPAACLCICIHLEQVSSSRLARTTTMDKRRRQYFELFMCVGLPLIIMALHYVVQGHRFDIIENYGCRPTTYFSIPGIFIVWIPPILVALGVLLFAALALRHFMQRRISFAAHLHTSNSTLTPSRYLRLMAMSALQMFWALALSTYSLWFTVLTNPIRPWTTWSDVHSNFSRIALFPELFTPDLVLQSFYVLWWLVPASTFVFVAFFSFGKDAMDEYKKCISWIKFHVLRRPHFSKDLKGPFRKIRLSNNSRTLPISDPTLIASSNGHTSLSLSYLSSKVPFSPTELDTISEASHYLFPSTSLHKTTAIGSVSDLFVTLTPATAVPPYDDNYTHETITPSCFPPSSPSAPSPSHQPPQVLPHSIARQMPLSPRPLTYPVYNCSFGDIPLTTLGNH